MRYADSKNKSSLWKLMEILDKIPEDREDPIVMDCHELSRKSGVALTSIRNRFGLPLHERGYRILMGQKSIYSCKENIKHLRRII